MSFMMPPLPNRSASHDSDDLEIARQFAIALPED
jgi:hypothetical protein